LSPIAGPAVGGYLGCDKAGGTEFLPEEFEGVLRGVPPAESGGPRDAKGPNHR